MIARRKRIITNGKVEVLVEKDKLEEIRDAFRDMHKHMVDYDPDRADLYSGLLDDLNRFVEN